MAHGRRAGWQAAIGLHLGDYAHILAAAFSLAALLDAVPILMPRSSSRALPTWSGWATACSSPGIPSPGQSPRPTAGGARRALWQSILVELLNPKTALFFLAFLPQFVDLAAAFPV